MRFAQTNCFVTCMTMHDKPRSTWVMRCEDCPSRSAVRRRELAHERDPPIERVVDGLRGGRAVGDLLPLR
jgi:hypothetical protein